MDLALNNLKRLICHKTQQTKPKLFIKDYYYYLKPYNCVQIICIKNSYLKLELFTKDYY